MNPEILDRDEFIVVGVRKVLEAGPQTVGALWKDQILPRRNEVNSADKRYYCVFSIPPSEDKRERYEYVAGAIGSLESIPTGMVGWPIPSGKYAQTIAVGLEGIAPTCRNLVTDWLPDSGYSMTQGVIFAYTDDENPESPSAKWKVNIPVETPEVLEELMKWFA